MARGRIARVTSCSLRASVCLRQLRGLTTREGDPLRQGSGSLKLEFGSVSHLWGMVRDVVWRTTESEHLCQTGESSRSYNMMV
jgi:hypothetical protein